jgi:uncharacterized protein YggU (UPF0235/DUF167 family)
MLIESCQEGVILTIQAFPGAKRNEVRIGTDDFLKVSVTQIPEKGKANEAIRKQIIKSLNLRASQVELLQGETSQRKKFLLRNVDEDEIRKTIEGIKNQQAE